MTQSILDDLAAAVRAVDPALGDQLSRMAPLGNGVVSVRLLSFVTELSAEISQGLPAGRVEVRLTSADMPELVYIESERGPAVAAGDEGEPTRLTLRLPQGIKEQAERAAGNAGVSLNTWVVTRLSEALGRHPRGGGHRLTGFGKA